jgi:CheY-like chemotaxis protein
MCETASERVNDPPFILVVDDHETQRMLFKLLVEHLKIAVHVVASAAEALEAVETYKFDGILMDVRMPDIDGLECAKKIRALEIISGHHIPIIAVTACCFSTDKDNCLNAGMDDYLSKPFSLVQLEEKLDLWIRRLPKGVTWVEHTRS